MEGRLAALHTQPHRASGPPLPRRRTRPGGGGLPPRSDPRTAEGLRAPIVWTHLRLVCRSGPPESGSRRIARERGARMVPVASSRKVDLYTHARNEIGLRFWKKMGFET